jgi:thioredoxin reductase (NADPH)
MQDQIIDCAVIGGGPAGLTAAIYLARYRRSVTVFDLGKSRAALIPRSRNYPGFPTGVSGPELLQLLREQAAHYEVPIVSSEVSALAREGEHFRVAFEAGVVTTRNVLIATGIVDVAPAMEGHDAAVHLGLIRYCPICDAYEAANKRIAVLGNDEAAVNKAKFLREYSRHITILPNSPEPQFRPDAVEETGIEVERGPAEIEIRDGKVWAVLPHARRCFDVLYPSLGCSAGSALAVSLGADVNDVGCLRVDEHQQTSVPGIYAAGDVVSDLHQITVATGHAAIAATHIRKTLPPKPC